MTNFSREQAADPATPPELLARIAHERPDLRPAVAANPSAYPGLLTWMEGFGDPAVLEAVQARSAAGQPVPAGQTSPVVPEGYGQPAGYGQAQDFPLQGEETQPRKRGKGLLIGGIAAGAILLIGGGAFAANQFFFSKIKGADSPEAAVTNLVEGVGNKDALSIYGALSPAEFAQSKAQFDSFEAKFETQESYGKFDENFGKIVDALDVELEGLEVQVEPIEDGLAKVLIVDGTLTVDGDPEELASLSADLVDETVASMEMLFSGLAEAPPSRDELEAELKADFEEELPTTLMADDLKTSAGESGFLMAVEEGGNWYVSPYLTMAEVAFLESGRGERGRLPNAESIKTFGTPEEAASGMTDAVVAFAGNGDVDEFVNVLPLAERRVLALYGESKFEGMAEELAGLEIKSNTFSVRDKDGDLANVVFEGFEVEAAEGSETMNLKLSGPCTVMTMNSEPFADVCFDEAPLLKEFGLQDLSFVTLKEGDSWFLSPTSTVVDALFTVGARALQLLDEGKLDDQQWIEQESQALEEYLMEQPGYAALFGGVAAMDEFDGENFEFDEDFDFEEDSEFGEDFDFDFDADEPDGVGLDEGPLFEEGELTQEEIDEMIELSEELMEEQKKMVEGFANY